MKLFSPFFLILFICLFIGFCNRKHTYTEQQISVSGKHAYIAYSPTCPICIRNKFSIQKVALKYPQIKWHIVNLNPLIKLDTIFQKPFFTIELKNSLSICKQLGLYVTPQIVFLQNGTKVYSGKLTNQFEQLGANRGAISFNFMDSISNKLTNGTKQNITNTKPIGCFIEFN